MLSAGQKRIELLGSEMQNWLITVVDTGLDSNIGERLLRVGAPLFGAYAALVTRLLA